MNLDRLNQWLTLAANVGVIAGFVLLAVQMKGNTNALELQNQIELGRGAMTIELAAMGDSVQAASTAAMLRPSSLTDKQVYQLFLYVDSVMNVVWNTWMAYQAGDATKEDWDAARAWAGYLFSYDAAKLIWNRYKHGYDRSFTDAIDGDLARQGDNMQQDFGGMVADIHKLATPAPSGR